jgi:flavin-dependent dehydrogenase
MPEALNVRCCIAGGGPAGMVLGLLLARAGVQVLVLEKHADFLRDFRGDTVHPSTLEVIHELGLLEKFLARPHDEVSELRAVVGDTELVLASFRHLHLRCKFIAMMPQWEFLDFVRDEAELYPGFRLIQNAEVTGVMQQGGVVTGVEVATPEGTLQVRADLVIGADGRRSTVRSSAGLVVRDLDKSRTFYEGVFKVLDIPVVQTPDGFFWADEFVVSAADSEAAQGALTGRHHVAFQAKDRATVDAFYRAALEHGGKDNGAPGERAHYHPGYYAAFVLDPDGNNIEAVYHGPAERSADSVTVTFPG